MQKIQETELLALVRQMSSNQQEMFLGLAQDCVTRNKKKRPDLRLVVFDGSPLPLQANGSLGRIKNK